MKDLFSSIFVLAVNKDASVDDYCERAGSLCVVIDFCPESLCGCYHSC